jgi:hypothetical protein
MAQWYSDKAKGLEDREIAFWYSVGVNDVSVLPIIHVEAVAHLTPYSVHSGGTFHCIKRPLREFFFNHLTLLLSL